MAVLRKTKLSLALKPGITFPAGDEAKGLGTGKSAYSLYLVTTVAPEPWAFTCIWAISAIAMS
jgi:hypothetical protein